MAGHTTPTCRPLPLTLSSAGPQSGEPVAPTLAASPDMRDRELDAWCMAWAVDLAPATLPEAPAACSADMAGEMGHTCSSLATEMDTSSRLLLAPSSTAAPAPAPAPAPELRLAIVGDAAFPEPPGTTVMARSDVASV